MKKAALLFNIFLVTGILFVTNTEAVMAGPHQALIPDSGNYTVGQEFSVTSAMTSGGEVVGGADGVGTYDANILELVSVEKASSMVFSSTDDGGNCVISEAESGKFGYSCYSNNNTSSNSDSGDLVTFNFRAKAVGTGLVKYTCTQGSTTDTNVIKADPVSDVIVCSENKNGSYVITAGSGTPRPTSTPTPVSVDTDDEEIVEDEATTEELPKTGGFGATLGLVLFGVVSVVSAVFLKFL